ncbi:hypothetical protein KAK06_00350 [Ideonella sp. 4Y11]|uniref:Uncharacterized protein n=1 Tax=Ideonella aquatica TaxID=2824119 RepID=A0A940YC02_9BURK|nr:hypothetical protein [Ideonella aquatica]MBQ0957393.1 hypothetical protein [Ideonella aquatica]
MSRSRAEAATVATSQELLRSALRRSQRRNTWVARRRLAWRWSVYLLGKALVYLGPPLLVASLAAWWWLQRVNTGDVPLPTVPAVAPAPAPAAPPAAAEAVAASAPLQLRLDDESLMAQPPVRHRRLPLRSPEAASAADAQESM